MGEKPRQRRRPEKSGQYSRDNRTVFFVDSEASSGLSDELSRHID